MSVEVIIDCPLGMPACERISKEDGKLHRCAWYVMVEGKNPQSEEYIREWRCAIAWMPIMQVEVAETNRGQTGAICSFRDEIAEPMRIFSSVLKKAALSSGRKSHAIETRGDGG